MQKLQLIRQLYKELNQEGLDYCHWKSNNNLNLMLQGIDDLDLLVSEKSRKSFMVLIKGLGFIEAVQPRYERTPEVKHFYAIDYESLKIVHLHAYFNLITGGIVLKNYHFPIEMDYISSFQEIEGVRIPKPYIELCVFVLRKTIENGNLIEHLLLRRDWSKMQSELNWLSNHSNAEVLTSASDFTNEKFPTLSKKIFSKCFHALLNPPSLNSVFLGFKTKLMLRMYAESGFLSSLFKYINRFIIRLYKRLFKSGPTHRLKTGFVVGVVGHDGAGKSTLVDGLYDTLSSYLKTKVVHVGKPPPSLLTFIPNLLIPSLRRMLPSFRTGEIQVESTENKSYKLSGMRLFLYSLRAVSIAYDRKCLIESIFKKRKNGLIVICDRYPSLGLGAMDSRQLDPEADFVRQSKLASWLAKVEARLYQNLPSADLILELQTSLKVALARNKEREDSDTERWIEKRHGQSSNYNFGGAPHKIIESDAERSEVLKQSLAELWTGVLQENS